VSHGPLRSAGQTDVAYRPRSQRPGWSCGRSPSGQRNKRSASAIGRSLMLASHQRIRPSLSGSLDLKLGSRNMNMQFAGKAVLVRARSRGSAAR
jgi:hypothetical protein